MRTRGLEDMEIEGLGDWGLGEPGIGWLGDWGTGWAKRQNWVTEGQGNRG